MYQCNFIIVKSNEAITYLKEKDYSTTTCAASPEGWTACYCYNRCYIDQMVGSRALDLKEEGKYPYQLSASDYKRAIQKENDILERQLSRMGEAGFWEKRKQYDNYRKKMLRLEREVRERDGADDLTEKEIIMLNEKVDELGMLDQKMQEFQEDEAFMEAYRYAQVDEGWSRIQIRERQREINSNSYNMHEYYYYRKLFSGILRYDPYVYFTYHDEGNAKEHCLVKEIWIEELQIGDLAMLCSYDILKICRKK